MPLPDAPKPITSNLYRQLNSDRIEDLSPKKFAVVRNPVFTNDVSEDELRRINVAGQAAGQVSGSGPLVNSLIVAKTIEQTSTGNIEIFAPGQDPSDNESIQDYDGTAIQTDQQYLYGVWKLLGLSTVQTGSSWVGNFKVYISVGGSKVYLTDLNNSAGTAPIWTEANGSQNAFVSGNSVLGCQVSTVSGTLTKFELSALLIRVR